jgi:hypothetical protein
MFLFQSVYELSIDTTIIKYYEDFLGWGMRGGNGCFFRQYGLYIQLLSPHQRSCEGI